MSLAPAAAAAPLEDWLRLARTETVGPATFRALLARFGTPTRALERLPDLARAGGRTRPLRLPPLGEITAELDRLHALGGRLLTLADPVYPRALADLPDAPPVLSALGHPHLLSRPMIALVGARNASLAGRRMAEMLAEGLGRAGLVVVSGLARGIDAAAHRAALGTGTIAAVAGGVDQVYPPENQALWEAMRAEGLVLAEMPFGTTPQARLFPRRNRIIAGLSMATVVVEAAQRSGALITARMAGEYGREVLAVPGSPLDPRARGGNELIREGATLVETAEQVLEALPGVAPRPVAAPTQAALLQPFDALDEEGEAPEPVRQRVLECLGPTPVTVDDIVRECQVSPRVVLTILLELELADRIERQPGNRVSLI